MNKYLDKAGLQDYTTKLTAKYDGRYATHAMVGSPLVAQTAADMTDTDKVYVYVGSETGYVNGDWYYYDGSAWQDGGVYNSAAVVLDDTLTQPDEAAEAKAVGDALKGYAKIDGDYETLGSGTSENLKSSKKETDTEPYNYRTTGGNVDVGSQENFKSLVGGTLTINQLANPINTHTTNDVTCTKNDDGTITLNGTANADGALGTHSYTTPRIAGHKYLICMNKEVFDTGATLFSSIAGTNTLYSQNTILVAQTDGLLVASVRASQGTVFDNVNCRLMVIDLTALFGTIPQTVGGTNYNSIADYVYSLGNTNGVAWLYKYFPILNGGYIPYSATNLGSVCCDKHITTGLNQFNKNSSYEGGTYRYSDVPIGKTQTLYMSLIDKDTTISMSGIYLGFTKKGAEYPVPTDSIRWVVSDGIVQVNHTNISLAGNNLLDTITVYPKNTDTWNKINSRWDICVHIEYDGEMNGVYEPYEANTYDMGHETLRGIYMLDSFGNLFLDPTKNDTKTSDGEITRRRKKVAINTLSWSEYSGDTTGHSFIANAPSDIKAVANNNGVANLICNNYSVNYFGTTTHLETLDKVICQIIAPNRLIIRDTAYSTASAFTTAHGSDEIEYELDEPTTESGTEYTELQKCHNWGTEELTDYEVGQGNRVVSIPVGHVTEYPVDLKAKLEMLPSAPLEDGDYICRVVNGEAQFVPIGSEFPEAPTEDGTFTLKATVSSGEATLSWVAEE